MMSLSVTEHSKVTSGALLLVWLREAHNIDKLIVHALQWQELNLMQQILEIVTFVNQETQQMGLRMVDYIPVTDSGMGSSVRVAAVRVPSLSHGSVYSFLLLLQM